MIADHFSNTLQEIAALHHMYATLLDVGLLVFARIMGFILLAPIFGRKDIPFTVKMSMSLALTWVIMPHIPTHLPDKTLAVIDEPILYSIQILINITIGAIIGFIADCIMEVINSAGDLMNNQIGLSSAMLFDPGRGAQVALLDKFFSFLAMMVFFELGGAYWLINAINRSFYIFPAYSTHPDITGQISLAYLIQITGNCLEIGFVLVAPVVVVTMAIDMILGIVNRTAQQIQVFQLSFALKPSIGVAVFLLTFPMFLHLLQNYLTDYAPIF